MPPLASVFSGNTPSINPTGGASGGISTGQITNGINTITFPASSSMTGMLLIGVVGGIAWLLLKKK